MSRVTASTDIDKVSDDDVSRFTELALENIVNVINGNLDFQTNVNCKIVSVTFSGANTDMQFNHGLGRVPVGYLVISSSVAANIYNGSSSATTSSITLKSTAPATVGLIIF